MVCVAGFISKKVFKDFWMVKAEFESIIDVVNEICVLGLRNKCRAWYLLSTGIGGYIWYFLYLTSPGKTISSYTKSSGEWAARCMAFPSDCSSTEMMMSSLRYLRGGWKRWDKRNVESGEDEEVTGPALVGVVDIWIAWGWVFWWSLS